jgi:AraC family transcriptional regulator, regulatory protein of adaptative response / methylated-DNA-[protein]-cysteine methyltransferase
MNACAHRVTGPFDIPTRGNRKNATIHYAGDAERWQAIVQRDPGAAGAFVYAVRTTGIYCRPTCASRQPNRRNVLFFANSAAAERAGFRACRRCHPRQLTVLSRAADLVKEACEWIERAEQRPRLSDLAAAVGVSPFHLHRLFKRILGVTPKEYSTSHRAAGLKTSLRRNHSAMTAAYEAGFGSSSAAHDDRANRLGMTPERFRRGAVGIRLRLAVAESSLGWVLVAATDRGVCAIDFGDSSDELRSSLRRRFPKAEIVESDRPFKSWVRKVVSWIETPSGGLSLPLDIQGTAFQQRVWRALQDIPVGSKASYAEIARRVGQPKAARAVAHACASNSLPIAIPCHRVVRRDGDLAGYRWGLERKRALLAREARPSGRGRELSS